MTEGSFSPLRSSFPHFGFCCSLAVSFPSLPQSCWLFFALWLFYSLFSSLILSHTLIVYCLKDKDEEKLFSTNVYVISFKCFNLLLGYSFPLLKCNNTSSLCPSSLSPLPQCYWEAVFHTYVMDGGQNWASGRALHDLISGPLLHSSSWAAVFFL